MKLVIATRLHLGRASSPPTIDTTRNIVANLISIADDSSLVEDYKTEVLIAVDATPRLEGYDYVEAVRSAFEHSNRINGVKSSNNVHIIPVTPWGKFVPALNSLVLHAKTQLNADLIMFVSAEVNLACTTVRTLCRHVTENKNVIVAGAAMNGHQYQSDSSSNDGSSKRKVVPLTGRTTPWNTLCVWDLDKLSMTGFSMISDLGKSGGVEECVAIALLQRIFPESEARLVKVDGFEWEDAFQDEERRKWHDEKMRSKVERPRHQLELLQLSGTVVHC
mmetsp:Transcript_13288/g.26684  ORF Transcript_13288/g.26684 Transcript_13288/m.26684 type:complete len:277 (+) Transcript_13288:127-957(+)